MRLISTYERFHRHVAAWADGEIDSLLVTGKPGYGKSQAYKSILAGRSHHVFGGRQSPIQVYNALYDAPHLPTVLDDISSLLRDANFIDMLKGLCETGRKLIRWNTTTHKLEGRETSFVSTAPVLIVLNSIPEKDMDVRAVVDRSDSIIFEPTKTEVISRMRAVFPEDGVLIDLLAQLPATPSLRTLVKAKQWQKSKHLNLVEELLAECGVPPPVATLVHIMESLPEQEWCSAYVAATGMTDRSFRRHKMLAQEIVVCRESAQ